MPRLTVIDAAAPRAATPERLPLSGLGALDIAIVTVIALVPTLFVLSVGLGAFGIRLV